MTQQKKKLDSRIPTLIKNGVETNHRSFFVIVGDRGRDQVVTLHYLLSKQLLKRPSVLWCYKKELGFSSNRKKRMNLVKKEIARGTRSIDEDDPFELFVSSTAIRYTFYKETEKILGQTFGMLVLQDFEALTPNLLARTIETVQGGGIVVLLLKTMTSLKQLYSMTMDVHARYRTEAYQDTVARFNERFILSLGSCDTCLVVDDELNVLPLSAGKDVKPLLMEEKELTESEKELQELKESLKDTQPVGALVNCTKTLDQAKSVLTFVEAIAEKTLKSTVALTAARGRGKSASLGIAIASAVAYGYSNIFITSPSPENLKTLFEFIFKGFDALGYEEHLDYDILQSSNPNFNKAVVRVNLFRDHRQTIQWIQPGDYHVLAQAELLVIDEAAAIPLPIVKKLLGPYLVFMASTVNGYEGTGRSLSLKLIKQLREQSAGVDASRDDTIVNRDGKKSDLKPNNRSLREIKLSEPIRYAAGDSVESWLNKLLCLDVSQTKTISGCPHPNECELYYVSRDTLFSYHPVSELFLQKLMSLYVASHYKNTPNDLQLLSDAPAHHLFVLLAPSDGTTVPEPVCVVQVCMEGQIARQSALLELSRGIRKDGDLIPWVVSQQYQDDEFASLSGARVVRIAVSPEYVGMGYGSRAMELLEGYYSGQVVGLELDTVNDVRVTDAEIENATLNNEKITVRDAKSMPPLLLKLSERPCKENVQWLGVSYGITGELQKFWKRGGFQPVYLRQTRNEVTGEHTCIMLKQVRSQGGDWLPLFVSDFRKRFIELLAYQFNSFPTSLVLSILQSSETSTQDDNVMNTPEKVNRYFTPHDLKRLASYSQNLLDYHVIMDLVPTVAKLYFLNLLHNGDEKIQFSAVQAAILVALGLQKKVVEDVEQDLGLKVSQILAIFAKSIKKTSMFLESVVEKGALAAHDSRIGVVSGKDVNDEMEWDPNPEPLNDELEEAGSKVMQELKEKQRELIDGLGLDKYCLLIRYTISGTDADWNAVKLSSTSKIVGIKNDASSKKRKMEDAKGTADGIIEKSGNGGVNDPRGLIEKLKKKKEKMKSKQSQKRMNK